MAVCVRVVNGMSGVSGRRGCRTYNICGIAGYLTDICILNMARNLTDICVYNKTIRNADDVDDATVKALDDLTLIYEWEADRKTEDEWNVDITTAATGECLQKLKGRHVAAWAKGLVEAKGK